MTEVIHGNAGGDQLNASADKTQVYGLKGNDTLISDNKSDVLLIGGSGDDSLIMAGGNGTLSGGEGKDTFELTYSADKKISAVIEDFEPGSDKIVVNFDGNISAIPQLNTVTSGDDVVLADGNNFNLTLKSVRENDYFDGSGSAADDERIFEILRLTNIERENPTMPEEPKAPDAPKGSDAYKMYEEAYEKYKKEYAEQERLVKGAKNLPPLTLSEGLAAGAAIRASEIAEIGASEMENYKHKRPYDENGNLVAPTEARPYYTVLEGKYSTPGENLHAGDEFPADVVSSWIGSLSHHKNILDERFNKLGVGYKDSPRSGMSDSRYYWAQLFANNLSSPTQIDLSGISAPLVNAVSKSVTLGLNDNPYSNSINGATISGTSSADSIVNAGLVVSISGNGGSDTIENSGSFTTINAGAGDDSIKISSDSNLIQYRAGDGDDTISGFNVTDMLSIAGAEYTPVTIGNDVVVKVGSDSIALLNAAKLSIDDNIDGTRSKLFILRDDVDDTINNTVDGATIQALGGGDTITNSGSNVIIEAGAGDDSLVNHGGKNVRFVYESGDDTIEGFNSTSTLQIATDTVTSSRSNYGYGNDIILTFGNGSIKLLNAAGLSSLNIVNPNGSPVKVIDGKDNVGDDIAETINNTVHGATIDARGGNDLITNTGFQVSISGGAGDDTIDNKEGAYATINGGAGNDKISLHSASIIEYNVGDGDDTIYGYDGSNILIYGGVTHSEKEVGNDVRIDIISNSATVGSITLKDYSLSQRIRFFSVSSEAVNKIYNKDNSVAVNGTKGRDDISNHGENVTINADAGDDDVDNYGSNVTIDGGNGEDIVRNVGNTLELIENVSIIGGDGNDYILSNSSSTTIRGGDGKDDIENLFYTLMDTSTGELSGHVGENFLIDGGANDDKIGNIGNKATIDGGDGNDVISNGGWFSSSNVSINGGNDNGNDYISNSGDTVTIDGGGGDDTITNDGSYVTINGGAGKDEIYNGGSSVTIDGGAGGDKIYYKVKSDFVPADAFTYNGHSYYVYSGVADNWEEANNYCLTLGGHLAVINDAAENTAIYNYMKSKGYDSAFFGISDADHEGTWTWVNGESSTYRNWASGEPSNGDNADKPENYGMFYWQFTDGKWNDGDFGHYVITDNGGKNFICEWDNNDDLIKKGGSAVSINGGADNDTISNSDGTNISILGGKGDDRISLMSDSKNNLIRYALGDGDDTVWGLTENDTLNLLLTSEELESCSSIISGKDVIVTVGEGTPNKGTILIKGYAGMRLRVTHGESQTDGGREVGLRDGGRDASSPGKDGDGNGGKDNSQGGPSTNEGKENAATPGKSAVGKGGNGGRGTSTSTNSSGNDNGSRRNPTTTTNTSGNSNNTSETSNNPSTSIDDVINKKSGVITIYDAETNTSLIDGRGLMGFEVISGSIGSDLIYASDGGSQLYGGADNVSDTLVGNGGADVFIGGRMQGSDFFLNVSSADVVFLNDAILSDIIGAQEIDGTVWLAFNTGNVVAIQNSEALSPNVMLADGSTYQYNIATKTWKTTQYVYPGSNMIISDYTPDAKILFQAEYAGAAFDGAGNFIAGSTTGVLVVQNAVDKVVDLRDYKGDTCLKAYAASTAGVIDGRGIAGFEIINGSAGADLIFAGDGGSQLWGGADTAADTLVGGNGTDIFIGGKTQGGDIFLNASSADIVHLNDAMLSDIIATEENKGAIAIAFNTGNAVAVQSTEPLSAAVMLADGSAYRYNHENKSWQTA